MYREVGPDEYDDVARRRPASCPLRAFGDARDGRRLLADYPADDAWTLPALARTPAGARYLGSLAASLAGVAGWFAAAGSARPTTRVGGGARTRASRLPEASKSAPSRLRLRLGGGLPGRPDRAQPNGPGPTSPTEHGPTDRTGPNRPDRKKMGRPECRESNRERRHKNLIACHAN